MRYYCSVKKKLTHNDLVLADAKEERDRNVIGFGAQIDLFRSRIRKGNKTAAVKLETLYLGYLYATGQYKECSLRAGEYNEYFKSIDEPLYIGLTQHYIARCNMTKGLLAEAMEGLMQSLDIYAQIGEAELALNTEDALGDVFFAMGFYDQSLAILYKHKQIATDRQNEIGQVLLSSKICNIYKESGRIDECDALLTSMRSTIESGSVPMPFPLAYWREQADYYIHIGLPQLALDIYETYYGKKISNYAHAYAYGELINAKSLIGLKQYDKAEISCREFIGLCQKADFRILLLTGVRLLVDIHILRGDLDQGYKELQKYKALKPATIGLKFELMYEQCCAHYYERADQSKSAIHHYKNCIELQHRIQKKDGEIKLRALHQLSLSNFKDKELNDIKTQLQMKRDELEVSAIYLKQHQAMLSELDAFMKELREDNKRKKNLFKVVHDKIRALQLHDSDKKQIEDKINSEQQQYIVRLKTKFPNLSLTEARVCSLLRSGLSSKEIAALLIIDVHTVEQHRYRIRKKLNINKGDDLIYLLNKL